MNQWIEAARKDLGVREIINFPRHNNNEDYHRFCTHCNRHTESFMKDEYRCRNCFRDKPRLTEIEKLFQKLVEKDFEKIYQLCGKRS